MVNGRREEKEGDNKGLQKDNLMNDYLNILR